MGKLFKGIWTLCFVLLPSLAQADDRKLLDQEMGLHISCLSNPMEKGWEVIQRVNQYVLLAYIPDTFEIDTDAMPDIYDRGLEYRMPSKIWRAYHLAHPDQLASYRIVVHDFPCFYEYQSKGSSMTTNGLVSHGFPRIEIDGHRYEHHVDEPTLRAILPALKNRCGLISSIEFRSFPTTSWRLKDTQEEHCARQINSVLAFYSVVIYLREDAKSDLSTKLHFILGRPYIGTREIELWD